MLRQSLFRACSSRYLLSIAELPSRRRFRPSVSSRFPKFMVSISSLTSSRVLPTSGLPSISRNRIQVRQELSARASQEASTSTDKMTLRHIPSKNLHVSNPTSWLESRFHFSFAEYHNPENAEFGVLRVLNDDLVQPKSGFGTHAHRDMEIFTYIVDGNLTHKDSIGTSETLGRGSAQYMSAGRGIRHSEMNNERDLLRFLQIWIKPKKAGLQPNYGSRVFNKTDRHNKLQHVLTSSDNFRSEKDSGEGVIPIHQDCNIYVSEADPDIQQEFLLSKNRQAYLVCIEGGLSVCDSVRLETRDAVEILAGNEEDMFLTLKGDEKEGAHFLMIEMPLA